MPRRLRREARGAATIGYQLNVFVHVLSAVVWLGGMFFLGAVGAPVLRKAEPPAPGSPSFLRLRKWAAWLARVNTVLGIVLVYVAVRLARGG